jgi:hypothetical protein
MVEENVNANEQLFIEEIRPFCREFVEIRQISTKRF